MLPMRGHGGFSSEREDRFEPDDFARLLAECSDRLQAEHDRVIAKMVRDSMGSNNSGASGFVAETRPKVDFNHAANSGSNEQQNAPVRTNSNWSMTSSQNGGEGANQDSKMSPMSQHSEFASGGAAGGVSSVLGLWPIWRTKAEDLKDKMATSDLLASVLQGKGIKSRSSIRSEHNMKRQLRQVNESARTRCAMVRPDSPARIGWDILGIILLCLDLAWIPMQAFDPPDLDPITVFGWITLFYWGFDMFASCNTGFMAADGHIELSRRLVLKRYFTGWFSFDLMLVSIDGVSNVAALMESSGDDSLGDSAGMARSVRLLRVTRIFRILRLLRLWKLRQLIMAIQALIDSEWSTVSIAVCRNLLTIVAINHTLACSWFAVGRASEGMGRTWISQSGLEDKEMFQQYLVSLHWSLAQFTPGTTQIVPETTLELIFADLMLIFGMVIFTCFISSITSLMQAVWAVNRHRTTQDWLLKKFLRQCKVSSGLFSRITRYTDLVVERQQKTLHPSKVQFLNLLSGPLHIELQTELYSPRLYMHPFFKAYGEACMSAVRELCFKALVDHSFAKTDSIFHRAVEAHNMYFIVRGCAVYYFISSKIPDKRKIVKLDKDQWCCEATLWLRWVHCGEMKALTESDIVALNGAKFREVTAGHYEAFLAAKAYAEQFWQRLREIGATEDREVSDVDFRLMDNIWSQDGRLLTSGETGNEGDNEINEAHIIEAQLMDWEEPDEGKADPSRKPSKRPADEVTRRKTRRQSTSSL